MRYILKQTFFYMTVIVIGFHSFLGPLSANCLNAKRDLIFELSERSLLKEIGKYSFFKNFSNNKNHTFTIFEFFYKIKTLSGKSYAELEQIPEYMELINLLDIAKSEIIPNNSQKRVKHPKRYVEVEKATKLLIDKLKISDITAEELLKRLSGSFLIPNIKEKSLKKEFAKKIQTYKNTAGLTLTNAKKRIITETAIFRLSLIKSSEFSFTFLGGNVLTIAYDSNRTTSDIDILIKPKNNTIVTEDNVISIIKTEFKKDYKDLINFKFKNIEDFDAGKRVYYQASISGEQKTYTIMLEIGFGQGVSLAKNIPYVNNRHAFYLYPADAFNWTIYPKEKIVADKLFAIAKTIYPAEREYTKVNLDTKKQDVKDFYNINSMTSNSRKSIINDVIKRVRVRDLYDIQFLLPTCDPKTLKNILKANVLATEENMTIILGNILLYNTYLASTENTYSSIIWTDQNLGINASLLTGQYNYTAKETMENILNWLRQNNFYIKD